MADNENSLTRPDFPEANQLETAAPAREVPGETASPTRDDEVEGEASDEVEDLDDQVPAQKAAKALGVSYRTLNRWIEDGELERVGRGLISKRSLVRALEDRRDSGPGRRGVTAEQLAQLSQAVATLTERLALSDRQLEAGAGERRELQRQRQQLEERYRETLIELERERSRVAQLASAGFLARRRLLRGWQAGSS